MHQKTLKLFENSSSLEIAKSFKIFCVCYFDANIIQTKLSLKQKRKPNSVILKNHKKQRTAWKTVENSSRRCDVILMTVMDSVENWTRQNEKRFILPEIASNPKKTPKIITFGQKDITKKI